MGYTLLVLTGAWCYHEARHSGLWVLVGGCAVLSGLFWLTRKQYHNQRRRVSLLLLGTSFLLKFFYVCYTPITRRQHDVGKFGDCLLYTSPSCCSITGCRILIRGDTGNSTTRPCIT